jgi:methylase of polypeptide subunit release factors
VDGVNTSGYEPRIALDGGEDGLDVISRFCRQAGGALSPGGSLLMEIGAGQRTAVVGILRGLFPSAISEKTATSASPPPLIKGERGGFKTLSISLYEREKRTSSAQIDVFPDLAGIDRAVCLTLPQ